MSKKLTSLLGLSLVALTACGGPNVKSGCQAMIKSNEDFTKQQGQDFCSCIDDETSSLKSSDRKTLGKLMKSSSDGDEFRDAVEKATEKGKLSEEGFAGFMGAGKSCSVKIAL